MGFREAVQTAAVLAGGAAFCGACIYADAPLRQKTALEWELLQCRLDPSEEGRAERRASLFDRSTRDFRFLSGTYFFSRLDDACGPSELPIDSE